MIGRFALGGLVFALGAGLCGAALGMRSTSASSHGLAVARKAAAPLSTAAGAPPSSGFVGTGTTGGAGGDDGSEGEGEGGGSDGGGGSGTVQSGTFGSGAAGAPSTSGSSGPGGRLSGLDVAAVTRLQIELKGLGYFHHAVTGWYGPVTTAAVRRFQRASGLKPDGVWGPRSATALTRRLAG